MKADKSVVNTINKRNILDIVRNTTQISRVELAQQTNLSLPTVMKLVDEFIAKDLILDAGNGVSTGGKPPKLLQFNYQAHYIIGVDINNSSIDVVLMDMAANVICDQIRDVGEKYSARYVIQHVITLIETVFQLSGVCKEKVLGIGIGIEGMIDNHTAAVRQMPALGWKDINVTRPIYEHFKLPVVVDNDTRAMAMGEKLVGIACGIENFICVNVRYNVDAALVLNGSLYYGTGFSAGEVGHMTVDKNGIPCDCGRRGCLNTVATPRAIEREARAAAAGLKKGQVTQILDMVYGHLDWINLYTLIDATENGDPLGISIMRRAADYVGMAIMNIVCMFNPQMVIVEGKLMRNSQVFMQELQDKLEKEKKYLPNSAFALELASLGKHLCAIGAAAFILNRFIESGGDA